MYLSFNCYRSFWIYICGAVKEPLSSTITSSTPALASWSPVQWRDDSNIGSHHLGSWPTSMSAQSSWEVRSLLEKVDAQNQVKNNRRSKIILGTKILG